MTIHTFEDLTVYQKAMSLTESIYKATAEGPFAKDWGLRDQLRRAAVSIISNIAEGYERDSTPEYRRFLLIAKGWPSWLLREILVTLAQRRPTV